MECHLENTLVQSTICDLFNASNLTGDACTCVNACRPRGLLAMYFLGWMIHHKKNIKLHVATAHRPKQKFVSWISVFVSFVRFKILLCLGFYLACWCEMETAHEKHSLTQTFESSDQDSIFFLTLCQIHAPFRNACEFSSFAAWFKQPALDNEIKMKSTPLHWKCMRVDDVDEIKGFWTLLFQFAWLIIADLFSLMLWCREKTLSQSNHILQCQNAHEMTCRSFSTRRVEWKKQNVVCSKKDCSLRHSILHQLPCHNFLCVD